MSDKDQQQAAAVENAATGDRGGMSQAELDELVASSDTGGRSVAGPVGLLLMLVALAWSLFQLYIASPFGLFNDTLARSIHLGFAIFLGILAFPAARTKFQLALGVIVPLALAGLFMVAAKDGVSSWWIPLPALFVAATVILGSPKDRIPLWEWALAIIGALAALYLFLFYRDIAVEKEEVERRQGADDRQGPLPEGDAVLGGAEDDGCRHEEGGERNPPARDAVLGRHHEKPGQGQGHDHSQGELELGAGGGEGEDAEEDSEAQVDGARQGVVEEPEGRGDVELEERPGQGHQHEQEPHRSGDGSPAGIGRGDKFVKFRLAHSAPVAGGGVFDGGSLLLVFV